MQTKSEPVYHIPAIHLPDPVRAIREFSPTSTAKRYIKITDHNGKMRRVYDPDSRLGRKRLCAYTHIVYWQVFQDGEVIGHLERASRGVYRCFCGNSRLSVRFNITEACDLVMNTHKRKNS